MRIFFQVLPKNFFQKIENPSDGSMMLPITTATIFAIGINIIAGRKIIALTSSG